jgi:hypothetical protein
VINGGPTGRDPTVKDLTVGHFRVCRYLERRSEKGRPSSRDARDSLFR